MVLRLTSKTLTSLIRMSLAQARGFGLKVGELVDRLWSSITGMLKEDWLILPGGNSSVNLSDGSLIFDSMDLIRIVDLDFTLDDRRQKELETIRQTYVPELVLRLHSVLFNTRDIIPSYVIIPSLSCRF
jgi:hypothetical protein